MYVCVYVCVLCMYVCMYVCLCGCRYVNLMSVTSICMCVYIYIYTHTIICLLAVVTNRNSNWRRLQYPSFSVHKSIWISGTFQVTFLRSSSRILPPVALVSQSVKHFMVSSGCSVNPAEHTLPFRHFIADWFKVYRLLSVEARSFHLPWVLRAC